MSNDSLLVDGSGRAIEQEIPPVETPPEAPAENKEAPKAQIAVDGDNRVTKVKGTDGKEYVVVNSATLMEIVVHKLENGQELSQVIAHEFMMVDHKRYLIKHLCDAIDTVMKAKKRAPLVKMLSAAAINRLGLKNFLNKKGGRR